MQRLTILRMSNNPPYNPSFPQQQQQQQGGGYPGYPPQQQPGYTGQQQNYPMQQQGYPGQPPPYSPDYPQQQPGYPPQQQQGYPPQQQPGYPQQQPNYPQQQQPNYPQQSLNPGTTVVVGAPPVVVHDKVFKKICPDLAKNEKRIGIYLFFVCFGMIISLFQKAHNPEFCNQELLRECIKS